MIDALQRQLLQPPAARRRREDLLEARRRDRLVDVGQPDARLELGRQRRLVDHERLEPPRAAVQRIECLDQRALRAATSSARRSGGQPRCSASSVSRARRIARRSASLRSLEREVDLGVEAHRAPGEVGRADDQQAVVDHHQLGVDVDRDPRLPLRRVHRVHDAQPVVATDAAQALAELVAAAVHHAGLEEALAEVGRDDHDLRPVVLGEPRRERLGDRRHGEVLVLEVDGAPGERDRRRGTAAWISRASAWRAEARPGAGDRDAARARHQGATPVGPGASAPSAGAGATRSPVARCQRSRPAPRGRARSRPRPSACSRGTAAARGARGSWARCSGRSQRPNERSRPPQNASRPSITTSFSCWQAPVGWWLSRTKRSRRGPRNWRCGRNSRSSAKNTSQSQTRMRIVSPRRSRTSPARKRLSGSALPSGSRLTSLRMSQPRISTLWRARAQRLAERGVVGRAVDQQRGAIGPGQAPEGLLAERRGERFGHRPRPAHASSGHARARRPPRRTGAIRRARPLASSVSR